MRETKVGRHDSSSCFHKVFHPWGTYQILGEGPQYRVRRLIVYPGQTLNPRKHYHRAEHWVVVRGTAIVTCGDEQKLLTANESTYVPVGRGHRLKNPGKLNLEIIEVQSGEYVGEDDVVELDDM